MNVYYLNFIHLCHFRGDVIWNCLKIRSKITHVLMKINTSKSQTVWSYFSRLIVVVHPSNSFDYWHPKKFKFIIIYNGY